VFLSLGVALLFLGMTLQLQAQHSTTAEAMPSGQSPFLLCILGDFSLGAPLADSIRGKTVHEKRVEICGVRKEQELRSCQVLFVSRPHRRNN
jgi:hypothetical protein